LSNTVCISVFNHLDVSAQKAAEFGRITQNNGQYAVEGHSRSTILVPIESRYATSC